jgi:hypothetical protein
MLLHNKLLPYLVLVHLGGLCLDLDGLNMLVVQGPRLSTRIKMNRRNVKFCKPFEEARKDLGECLLGRVEIAVSFHYELNYEDEWH